MADKLDFMNELAKDVEARKSGRTSSFGTVNDFVPKHQVQQTASGEDDYAIPSQVQSGQETPAEPAAAPEAPQVNDTQDSMYGGSTSPASFAQEERVKVEKEKFRVTPPMIGGVLALIVLIGALIWFFNFRASITLPDFTGRNLSEVTSWAAQNKIDSSALARKYEYSLEYGSDVVISQTPKGGTKIRKDTPITFTVSQGADPNESIEFPDIRSMTYEELTDWRDTNKLAKTKISTEYSTAVENGGVISYELKNVSESDFTRGSTLTIRCSKGPAPAGQVTVENFQGKNYSEALSWANAKKLQITREDVNNEKVESGYIISQSPAAGQSLKEGETFVVTVSKGKGVKVPNLVGYSSEQLEAWMSGKNNSSVTVVKKSVYSTEPNGSVIAQSVAPNTTLDAGDVLQLTISLYMPILETNSREWLGKDYLELRAWCDKVNFSGADIQAGSWGEWATPVCSDTYPTEGQIVQYACYYGTSDLADGCGRPLNNNSRINYRISSGPCTVPTPTPETTYVLTANSLSSLDSIVSFCKTNRIEFTAEPTAREDVKNVMIVLNGIEYSSTGPDFQVTVRSTDTIRIYYRVIPQEVPTPTPTPSPSPTASPDTEISDGPVEIAE